MEIKINKEIRNYTESMFFGLSMRQFFFSLIGVGAAILLYFLLRPCLGTETLSWICMLGAAPFMAMGFITYNGQTCERFMWAWIKSGFIEPRKVKFTCDTLYHELLQNTSARKPGKKEEKADDKNAEKYASSGQKRIQGTAIRP